MTGTVPTTPAPEGDTSREWNILALLAFGLTIAGLWALSTVWGGYVAGAGVVMGILALVLPAFRKKRGKFFAIMAIALPVLLMVIVIWALDRVWGS